MPFPSDILEVQLQDIIDLMKEATKKTVGEKKAKQLVEAAKMSIGIKELK